MTDGFKVGTGLKQGDGLAPDFFNVALEWVIRQLSVQTASIFHKSVQLTGYEDDINVMGRKKGPFQTYMVNWKREQKKLGLS